MALTSSLRFTNGPTNGFTNAGLRPGYQTRPTGPHQKAAPLRGPSIGAKEGAKEIAGWNVTEISPNVWSVTFETKGWQARIQGGQSTPLGFMITRDGPVFSEAVLRAYLPNWDDAKRHLMAPDPDNLDRGFLKQSPFAKDEMMVVGGIEALEEFMEKQGFSEDMRNAYTTLFDNVIKVWALVVKSSPMHKTLGTNEKKRVDTCCDAFKAQKKTEVQALWDKLEQVDKNDQRALNSILGDVKICLNKVKLGGLNDSNLRRIKDDLELLEEYCQAGEDVATINRILLRRESITKKTSEKTIARESCEMNLHVVGSVKPTKPVSNFLPWASDSIVPPPDKQDDQKKGLFFTRHGWLHEDERKQTGKKLKSQPELPAEKSKLTKRGLKSGVL